MDRHPLAQFYVAVAVGMSATVVGFVLGQSERFGHWYPWSIPLQVVAVVLGGLSVTALGLLDYRRREFS